MLYHPRLTAQVASHNGSTYQWKRKGNSNTTQIPLMPKKSTKWFSAGSSNCNSFSSVLQKQQWACCAFGLDSNHSKKKIMHKICMSVLPTHSSDPIRNKKVDLGFVRYSFVPSGHHNVHMRHTNHTTLDLHPSMADFHRSQPNLHSIQHLI